MSTPNETPRFRIASYNASCAYVGSVRYPTWKNPPMLTSLDSTLRFVGMSEAESTSTMNLLGTAAPGAELPPFKLETGKVLASAEPARSDGSRRAQDRDLMSTKGADGSHMHTNHCLYTVSRVALLGQASV